MIPETSQCATCGRKVPQTNSLLGAFCPACVLGAGRTPGTVPTKANTTTWAEVFPQLEVEATLVEVQGLSIYRARILDTDLPESAILQVLSGQALARAGGAALLEARMHHLASQSIEGLAGVLDFGDLADAFFLITAAPEFPPLSEKRSGVRGGLETLGDALPGLLEGSRSTLNSAWGQGIAVCDHPGTVFPSPNGGPILWTPALKPDAAGDSESGAEVEPQELTPGHSVGSYSLVRRAGEGGFGEVWQARQERPVERTVALKILKTGLHSKRARARFEAEQQALAKLDYPHIARFFDGGFTPDGHPFFAMEWIEGESLTRACERMDAPLAERLRLFRQVCEAVHHAHQKGIIHRDLKSSNVMVCSEGGTATAKVIDFGIARTAEAPDRTRITRAEEILGTPATMSPEQAAGAGATDLDARADVYGLGVLLYELLTGQLPFDPKLPADELRRKIREDDPPRPSTRIDDRRSQWRVKGELDWITLRCLEKDPARRYQSASAVLDDVERHQNEEPVKAGPPEASYRIRKFVKRNRVGVTAAALTLSALLAALILTMTGFRAAKVSEGEAKERLAESEEARREAQAIADFVYETFSPGVAKQGRLTLDDVLDRAVEALDGAEIRDPEHRYKLQTMLSDLYGSRGRHDMQVRLIEDLRRYLLSHESPAALRAKNARHLATNYTLEGRFADSIELLLAEIESAQRDGRDHTLYQKISIHDNLARCYRGLRKADEVARHQQIVKEVFESQYETDPWPDDHLSHKFSNPFHRYIDVLLRTGELDRAAEILRKRMSTLEEDLEGAGNLYAMTVERLANCYRLENRIDRAVKTGEQAIAKLEQQLGADHQEVLQLRASLIGEQGIQAFRDGRYTHALQEKRTLFKDCEAHLGLENQYTQSASFGLAQTLFYCGFHREVVDLTRRMLPYFPEVGTSNRSRAALESQLAGSLYHLGDYTGAYATLLHALRNERQLRDLVVNVGLFGSVWTPLSYQTEPRLTCANAEATLLLAGLSKLQQGAESEGLDALSLAVIQRLLSDPLMAGIDGSFRSPLFMAFAHSEDYGPSAPRLLVPRFPGGRWSPTVKSGRTDLPNAWTALDVDDSDWDQDFLAAGSIRSDAIELDEGEGWNVFRHRFEVPRGLRTRDMILASDGRPEARLHLNGKSIETSAEQIETPGNGTEQAPRLLRRFREEKAPEGWRQYEVSSDQLRDGTNLLTLSFPVSSRGKAEAVELVAGPAPAFADRLSVQLESFDPEPALAALEAEMGQDLPKLPAHWRPLVQGQLAALSGKWEEGLRHTRPLLDRIPAGTVGARFVARFRWLCHHKLGRKEDALAELPFGVPLRPVDAAPSQLDLSSHATSFIDELSERWASGHALTQVPPALAGQLRVPPLSFDVRSIVRIGNGPNDGLERLTRFPDKVTGIAVGRSVGALHFLHAAGVGSPIDKDILLGSYQIRFSDGATRTHPVRMDGIQCGSIGRSRKEAEKLAEQDKARGAIVWTGTGAGTIQDSTALFVSSWINPCPDVPIESIDLVSEDGRRSVLLFGITADPVGEPSLNPKQMADAALRSGLDLTNQVAQQVFADLGEHALEETDPVSLMRAGAVLALGEDPGRYLDFCRRLVDQYRDSEDPGLLDAGFRTLLLPQAASHPELLQAGLEMARRHCAHAPDHVMTPLLPELIAYCENQFSQAQQILDALPTDKNIHRSQIALLLRAMTAHHLGRRDEAVRTLNMAGSPIAKETAEFRQGEYDQWWGSLLARRSYLAEAESLIHGDAWEWSEFLNYSGPLDASAPEVESVLVPPDSEWRWLHPVDGVDPAQSVPDFHQSFSKLGFDDGTWQRGRDSEALGGFGYGEEWFTGVDIGLPELVNDKGKRDGKTAYFRHAFRTDRDHAHLELRCQFDDGVIIYLDGEEVARENMELAEESYLLPARRAVGRDREQTTYRIPLKGVTLAAGEHVLAISLHNTAGPSSDLRIGGISLVRVEVNPGSVD